jgi:hypothetical protein
MNRPNVDHLQVGLIVAFDADTGDVLHVHEKFVETIDGKPACSTDVTPDECEAVRLDAVRNHPRRRVDVLAAPPEMGQREDESPVRYHVDPMIRKLRVEPECDPRLATSFRLSKQVGPFA